MELEEAGIKEPAEKMSASATGVTNRRRLILGLAVTLKFLKLGAWREGAN